MKRLLIVALTLGLCSSLSATSSAAALTASVSQRFEYKGEDYIYPDSELDFSFDLYDEFELSLALKAGFYDDEFYFLPYRARFDLYRESFLFSFGLDSIRWGAGDGFVLNDVLMPIHHHKGIESERGAQPFFLLRSDFDHSALELIFFPSMLSGKKPGSKISDKLLSSTPFAGFDLESEPAFSFEKKRVGAAARYSSYLSALDFSLYAFSGLDPEFKTRMSSVKPMSLDLIFPRLNQMGFDFSIPLSDFVIRYEQSFAFDRTYCFDYLALSKSDEFRSLLGLDWNNSFCIISLQGYVKVPLEKKDNTESAVSLNLDKSFFEDRLSVSLSLVNHLDNLDGIFKLSLTYEINDNLKLKGLLLSPYKGKEGKGEWGLFEDLGFFSFGLSYVL